MEKNNLPAILTRRSARLQKRLERLRSISNRYSTYRILVFFGGISLCFLAWYSLPMPVTRLLIVGSLAAFISVVLLHRRLDRLIRSHEIWLDLYQKRLSRLLLDWEGLPQQTDLVFERGALDIDLDLTGPRSLHHLLDLSVSQEGSKRLAGWLANPKPDLAQITRRQALVGELTHLERFRNRLQLNLRLVSSEPLKGQRLLSWLDVDYPARRVTQLLPFALLLALLNWYLLIANLSGALPPYWIFSFVFTLAFTFYTSGNTVEFFHAVVELDSELEKFSALLRCLETFPLGESPGLKAMLSSFRQGQNRPSAILHRVKLITAGIGLRSNPIFAIFLNVLLPWDLVFALLAGRLQHQVGWLFRNWLETWVELDALISLADFAALNPDWSVPQVSPDIAAPFSTRQMGHPLIPASQRVCNDFTISELGEVNLITGSNMAGKSTFIKTIGVNLCLAYAGGSVCAAGLSLAPLRLHTCMRITDSIADGFSYFYAEVKCLKLLLEKLRQEDEAPLLYLVDEIFRGTNNRERLLGSQAYIQAVIGAHGIGLIATHDLELASLADRFTQVRNYHFRDEVDGGRLVFDYCLRPGPSPTTNALKIMEMEGLPVSGEWGAGN